MTLYIYTHTKLHRICPGTSQFQRFWSRARPDHQGFIDVLSQVDAKKARSGALPQLGRRVGHVFFLFKERMVMTR